jgi:formate hydrogenlyase subunit 4
MTGFELTPRGLIVAQALVYVLVSPFSVGFINWIKSRLQRRRGPGPLQPYRDLWRLLRTRPTRPESASVIFIVAPAVVFACFVLLGFALPTVAIAAGPGMDLLLVIGLLGLARFVTTLAAFDSASPFGPMSAGRQWYIHVLAEPALFVVTYTFAVTNATTNISHLITGGSGLSVAVRQPTISIALCFLFFILLAETGRLPFDRPGTHLELTMIEEGVLLEYSGRALALMNWAYAMKLTFSLSLIAFLAVPTSGSDLSPARFGVLLAAYFVKLLVLLVLLAMWETARNKMPLRAILPQIMLATGVLLFTLASLIFKQMNPGS